MPNAVIERLEQERAKQFEFIDTTMNKVQQDERDMVDAERQNVEAAHERVKEIDAQLKPLRDFEQLRDTDRQSASHYTGTAGSQGGGDQGGQRTGGDSGGLGSRQISDRAHQWRSAGEFLRDAYLAANTDEQGPGDRIRSAGIEVRNGQLVRAAVPHNTTAEVPGLLPEPIIGEVMNHIDAARPFVSSVGAKDLGGIPGLTFSRPTVTGHVTVGKQNGEKTEVPGGQFKVGSVPFNKDTYGGWANVSRQEMDFTSPAAWDALLADFIEIYGLETENAAASAFSTSVVEEVELTTALGGSPTLQEVLRALYAAARKSYQGSGRMPDHIWASLDWWETLGVVIDHLKATTAGDGGGSSSVNDFAGNLLRVPRTIVPSFESGELIVGVKSRTEVYEDRFGFLTAVEPKVLGLEIAYGGYMASGTIRPAAFAKIVNKA